MRRVSFKRYIERPPDARLSVGDVVRCREFEWGSRPRDASLPLTVAWHPNWRPYVEQSGWDTVANDPTRGEAPFLITSIVLNHGSGPDDIDREANWLARSVTAVRLSADLAFTGESERIAFSIGDPMSVAKVEESQLEVLGHVELPITWREPPGGK
jgi:hypothetical protein